MRRPLPCFLYKSFFYDCTLGSYTIRIFLENNKISINIHWKCLGYFRVIWQVFLYISSEVHSEGPFILSQKCISEDLDFSSRTLLVILQVTPCYLISGGEHTVSTNDLHQRIYITRSTDSNHPSSYKKSTHPTSHRLLCRQLYRWTGSAVYCTADRAGRGWVSWLFFL